MTDKHKSHWHYHGKNFKHKHKHSHKKSKNSKKGSKHKHKHKIKKNNYKLNQISEPINLNAPNLQLSQDNEYQQSIDPIIPNLQLSQNNEYQESISSDIELFEDETFIKTINSSLDEIDIKLKTEIDEFYSGSGNISLNELASNIRNSKFKSIQSLFKNIDKISLDLEEKLDKELKKIFKLKLSELLYKSKFIKYKYSFYNCDKAKDIQKKSMLNTLNLYDKQTNKIKERCSVLQDNLQNSEKNNNDIKIELEKKLEENAKLQKQIEDNIEKGFILGQKFSKFEEMLSKSKKEVEDLKIKNRNLNDRIKLFKAHIAELTGILTKEQLEQVDTFNQLYGGMKKNNILKELYNKSKYIEYKIKYLLIKY